MPSKKISDFPTTAISAPSDIFLIDHLGATATVAMSTVSGAIINGLDGATAIAKLSGAFIQKPTTPTAGQVLTYNGSTSTWVASAAPDNASSNVFINKLYENNKYGGGSYPYDSFGFVDSNGCARVIGNNIDSKFGSQHAYGPSYNTLALPAGELASKLYITTRNCAVITTTGKVYMSGVNTEGECGIGNITSINYLSACIGLPTNVSEIIITNEDSGSSANPTYALTDDGKVYAWGYNQYGSIGDGTVVQKTTPVLVIGPGNTYGNPTTNVIQLVSTGGYNGGSHLITTIALLSDGTVWAVGYGGNGQMGNNTNTATNNKFVQVLSITGIVKIGISGGDANVSGYALKNNGTLYAWGYNGYGELGNNTTTSPKLSAAAMLTTNMTNSVVVDFYLGGRIGGGTTVYVKTADDSIYACGLNDYGQLGLGTTGTTKILTKVTSLSNTGVSYIVPCFSDVGQAIAVCPNSVPQLYAVGYNAHGQLGLGHETNVHSFTPIRFYTENGIKDVRIIFSSGVGGFSMILTNKNEMYGTGISRWAMFSTTDNNIHRFKPLTNQSLG